MASQLVGAVVGKFKVGTGVKVGPPIFQPDKPKLTLKGKSFQVFAAGSITQVRPGKGSLRLGLVDVSHPAKRYTVNVSSTVAVAHSPDLTLRGKTGLRIVTPGRQVTAKSKVNLKAKSYRLNKSQSPRVGKARLVLKGGRVGKIGKAGLVPTVAGAKILVPTAVVEYGNLTPSPAEDGLLVPTVVEYV